MYEILLDKIFSELQYLVGDNFQRMEKAEILNPSVFPFVVVVEDDTTEEETIFDTVSNQARYRFKIRVVNSFADDDLWECAKQVRIIVDEILATIRRVRDWGDCVLSADTSVRWGYLNEEKQRIAEIGVSFLVLLDAL